MQQSPNLVLALSKFRVNSLTLLNMRECLLNVNPLHSIDSFKIVKFKGRTAERFLYFHVFDVYEPFSFSCIVYLHLQVNDMHTVSAILWRVILQSLTSKINGHILELLCAGLHCKSSRHYKISVLEKRLLTVLYHFLWAAPSIDSTPG